MIRNFKETEKTELRGQKKDQKNKRETGKLDEVTFQFPIRRWENTTQSENVLQIDQLVY